MLKGYRTYIAAGVVVLHQVAKLAGFDVPEESLSMFIDGLFGLLAIFFRSRA